MNPSPYRVPGITGFHPKNNTHADLAAQGENEKDKVGGMIPYPQGSDGQEFSQVHWQSLSLFTGSTDFLTTLQGTPENSKFSDSFPSVTRRDTRKVLDSTLLTAKAQKDLQWWDSQVAKFSSAQIQPPVTTVCYQVRCFKNWMGAVGQNVRTRGLWSIREALYHINNLELLAAFLALKTFVGKKMGLAVLLKMDKITALTYINKMGGSPLTFAMLPSTGDVGLMPREKHLGESQYKV